MNDGTAKAGVVSLPLGSESADITIRSIFLEFLFIGGTEVTRFAGNLFRRQQTSVS
jgi:hypothetical protein